MNTYNNQAIMLTESERLAIVEYLYELLQYTNNFIQWKKQDVINALKYMFSILQYANEDKFKANNSIGGTAFDDGFVQTFSAILKNLKPTQNNDNPLYANKEMVHVISRGFVSTLEAYCLVLGNRIEIITDEEITVGIMLGDFFLRLSKEFKRRCMFPDMNKVPELLNLIREAIITRNTSAHSSSLKMDSTKDFFRLTTIIKGIVCINTVSLHLYNARFGGIRFSSDTPGVLNIELENEKPILRNVPHYYVTTNGMNFIPIFQINLTKPVESKVRIKVNFKPQEGKEKTFSIKTISKEFAYIEYRKEQNSDCEPKSEENRKISIGENRNIVFINYDTPVLNALTELGFAETWNLTTEKKAVAFIQEVAICNNSFSNISKTSTDCILKELAIAGDVYAQYLVGFLYEQTISECDKAEDFYFMAAEQGYSEASYRLALCCMQNTNGKRRYKEAVEWLTDAADKDHIYAQHKLAVCYYNTSLNL